MKPKKFELFIIRKGGMLTSYAKENFFDKI